MGLQNRVLYLGRPFVLVISFILNFLAVTRDPVPGHIALTWRPSVSSKLRGSSNPRLELDSVLELDTDSDSAEDQSVGLQLAVDQDEDDIGVQTGNSFASE